MYPDPLDIRNCSNRRCRKEFKPKNTWQKYCSIRCRSNMGNLRRAKLVRMAQDMLTQRAQGKVQG